MIWFDGKESYSMDIILSFVISILMIQSHLQIEKNIQDLSQEEIDTLLVQVFEQISDEEKALRDNDYLSLQRAYHEEITTIQLEHML